MMSFFYFQLPKSFVSAEQPNFPFPMLVDLVCEMFFMFRTQFWFLIIDLLWIIRYLLW